MSITIYTAQQQAALDHKDSSVALSAGAGCGKTLVLARRFLGEIAPPGGRPLSRIQALTFTNKAARELRERVRRYCREEAQKPSNSETQKAWRTLVRSLEAPPIGTFHQFCGEVLRRFPTQAKIDPGFVIDESTRTSRYRNEAVEQLLRDRLIDRDRDVRALAIEYGLPQVRTILSGLLTHPDGRSLAESTPSEASVILRRWFEHWENLVKPNLIGQVVDQGRLALGFLAEDGCSKSATMKERWKNLDGLIYRIANEPDPSAVLDRVIEVARVQGTTKKNYSDEILYENIKDSLSVLRDRVKATRTGLIVNPDASLGTAETVARLARLATDASTRFQGIKRSASIIDYNDLLIATRNLFRDRPQEVRDRIASELDMILVDEFQDTDPIQEEIIRSIAGRNVSSGGLFLVGDVKQSIYGFRGARPDLFSRLQEEFPPEGRLPLSTNFRSVPGILDFVNALFAEAFLETYEPLVPPAGSIKSIAPECAPIVFLWSGTKKADGTPKPSADELRREEAQRIAGYLAEMIESGELVRAEKGGSLRPVRLGDFAILFRSLSNVAEYERTLADYDLDYHVLGGKAFYAQQEINDLANVLSILENPYDGVSLAGALRSPFFGVSDEALYWLSDAGKRPLFDGLRLAKDGGETRLESTDLERLQRAWQLLATWRTCKDRTSIGDLLDRILSDSGYESALLGESLGDRKRANVRKLVRLARRFDREGGTTAADFANQLRSDLKSGPKEGEAATTDEEGDVIRIMTIHQSKGLEFPVVILPDLDRKDAGDRESVVIDSEVGLVLRGRVDEEEQETDTLASENLGWVVHHYLQDARDQAEAVRLFYVATTRAKDRLVLSSAAWLETTPRSPAMRLLDSRFNRESGQLSVALPENLTSPKIEVVVGPEFAKPARSRRKRPDLLGVARSIENAPAPSLLRKPSRLAPREIDLCCFGQTDLNSSRIRTLIEFILGEPSLFKAGRLEDVLDRVRRLLKPWPSAAIIESVRLCVERLLETLVADEVRNAVEVRTRVEWSSLLKTSSREEVTLLGRVDLAYRSQGKAWSIVRITLNESESPSARAGLVLAADAWSRRQTVESAQLIQLGGSTVDIQRVDWNRSEVEIALSTLIQIAQA